MRTTSLYRNQVVSKEGNVTLTTKINRKNQLVAKIWSETILGLLSGQGLIPNQPLV